MRSLAPGPGTSFKVETEMDDLGVGEKIRTALDDSQYDGLILTGSSNVRYAIGAELPFRFGSPEERAIVVWPKEGSPTCVCPSKWEAAIMRLRRIQNVRPCDDPSSPEALAREVAHILCGSVRGQVKIGMDVAEGSYRLLMELEKRLPGAELRSCDAWFQKLRTVKTPEERALLAAIASRTDHGLLGAVHHLCVKTPMSEKRLAEEIRVHCLERGLDVAGHESFSQVASGPHVKKFWPLAPRYGNGWDRIPSAGELVRAEMRATLAGYWCDAARMVTMGPPNAGQQRAYEGLVTLRKTALRWLKPGRSCAEIFSAVEEEAERQGIKLVGELGVGHGVGVSPYEAPFLTSDNETVLSAGTVLVLDPVVFGPHSEIMRSKDTVLVTETGHRLIGWYKNWDEPYVAAYTF